ncbi:TP53-target gene 5 protein [Oryx dammah]|uniref:TP53-target gene 5 protein n=1 Tax=Oryx dammah TaxID=59534 RepID=UPI001A9BAC74|nr:TP53-target gene 5 protein [Oryx dammah]
MQAKEPQDKIHQPVNKVIARNRLKMVLKHLSLLKLLKSSKPRIQELYNLARRCWNSLLRVPKILGLSSGYDNVWDEVEQNNKELQEEAGCSYQKLVSKKLKPTGEPEGREGSRPRAQEAVSQREEQVGPEAGTSRGRGLTTGPRAQARQPPTGGPQVIFRKTHQDRTRVKDVKQPETVNQRVWFEGLPTRVHLPGPRVMCRSSTLRWVRPCCTRFCSASLEMPMVHRYKVGHHHRQARVKRWAQSLEGCGCQCWEARPSAQRGKPREAEATDQGHAAGQWTPQDPSRGSGEGGRWETWSCGGASIA